MLISTKGRYGVSIMLDMALGKMGEYTNLKTIAERQDLSGKYLERIISVLKKAGYVESARGAHGGYKLSKEPKEYTLGMILRLLEGNMAPVPCLENKNNTCYKRERCIPLIAWKQLDDAINEVIDRITLQDLVDWNEKNVNY